MTELERDWFARLDQRGGNIDLRAVWEEGDPVMRDLLAAFRPPRFELIPERGSHVTAMSDGLVVELTGLLVPEDVTSSTNTLTSMATPTKSKNRPVSVRGVAKHAKSSETTMRAVKKGRERIRKSGRRVASIS